MTKIKYLGQTTHLKDTTKEEIYSRIRAAWSCFGEKKKPQRNRKKTTTKKYFKISYSPYDSKTSNGQVGLTNNDLWLPDMVSSYQRTAQSMKREKMWSMKLQDNVPSSEIWQTDIEYNLKQYWMCTGHIVRMKDNRWPKHSTELQPTKWKRSSGRLSRRWLDDTV